MTQHELVPALIAAQEAGGGWGWHPGAEAVTECTALAVGALAAAPRTKETSAALARGVAWLHARQRTDGAWPESGRVSEASWMSSLPILALAQLEPGAAAVKRGALWLLAQESRGPGWLQRLMRRLNPGHTLVQQDTRLVGWSWTADTSAWVEPTAYALIVMRRLRELLPRARAQERIRQAELMLRDRMCRGGGWNYGNPRVLGEDLSPYPDTTALALLALQGQPRDAVVGQSIECLREMLRDASSALALALSVLALQSHGEDASAVRSELQARLGSRWISDEVRTLALTALALSPGATMFDLRRHA